MMKLLHRFVVDQIHGIAGITFRASVPETAVDIECSMRFFVITIEEIITNTFLAAAACVLNMDFALLSLQNLLLQPLFVFHAEDRLPMFDGMLSINT